MKLTGTPAKRPMKIVTDENGKTRAVIDQKKIEAMKPVCARKSNKVRVKRGGK